MLDQVDTRHLWCRMPALARDDRAAPRAQPYAGRERAKKGERHERKVEFPEPEQVRTLLSKLDQMPLSLGKMWIMSAPQLGYRPGEARGLFWNYGRYDAADP